MLQVPHCINSSHQHACAQAKPSVGPSHDADSATQVLPWLEPIMMRSHAVLRLCQKHFCCGLCCGQQPACSNLNSSHALGLPAFTLTRPDNRPAHQL